MTENHRETLDSGKHTVTAMFDDADPASADFTVTEKTPTPTATPTPTTAPKNPNTGDSNSLWIWAIMFAAALACMLAVVNRRSRNGK